MLPIAQPGPMTDDERFMFESFGYLMIEDVLTDQEIEDTLEASKRIHADTTEVWRQIGKGFETESAIENLIDHPAVLPKVRALYSDQFVLQSAWCTVQKANSGSIGWHQDGSGMYQFSKLSYPLPLLQLRASYSLTDQSHEMMGNMMMIPGSHRSPVPLPEHQRKALKASPIQHNVLCKAGAVLLFHNGMWHSPMPNDQDFDRYNMHYIYSPPWVRRSDRFETSAEFLERTTPLRRALMGEYDRPDAPFGGGAPPIPFDD